MRTQPHSSRAGGLLRNCRMPSVRPNRVLPIVFLIAMLGRGEVHAQTNSLLTIGEADSLYSTALSESRDYWVHLPSGGNLRPNHRYPVVYLLDGGMHLGALAALQEYYSPGKWPEMIVVAISNRSNRTRDLTPSTIETRNGGSVGDSGGADAFRAFLADELIPHIDSRYPTSSYRTLVGHSYAGLFAIATFASHTSLFRSYLALDPSLDWDNQLFLNETFERLASTRFDGTTLFVSIANTIPRFSDTLTIDDVQADTTEFSLGIRSELEFVHFMETLNAPGFRFAWQYYPHDSHWSVPIVSMADGFQFVFDWWELKSPSRFNNPDTPVDELVAIVRARADRLTAHLGYPEAMEEELLTMMGYMSMDMEQPDKAEAFFNMSIEYYPESASAHRSIVDFYLHRNDKEKALQHARKAYALSQSDDDRQRISDLLDKR